MRCDKIGPSRRAGGSSALCLSSQRVRRRERLHWCGIHETTAAQVEPKHSSRSRQQRRTSEGKSCANYRWGRYTTYVHNRTPTKALDRRTAFGVRYGAKPELAHLRAFRAPCAVVEPLEKSKEHDHHATMYFFVGYKYDGGYRIWDPKKQVVVESRDVVFLPEQIPTSR